MYPQAFFGQTHAFWNCFNFERCWRIFDSSIPLGVGTNDESTLLSCYLWSWLVTMPQCLGPGPVAMQPKSHISHESCAFQSVPTPAFSAVCNCNEHAVVHSSSTQRLPDFFTMGFPIFAIPPPKSDNGVMCRRRRDPHSSSAYPHR